MAIFVKLIASTPDAAKVVAAAAKICYSSSGAVDIMEGLDPGKIVSFLKMLRESGHFSPFEHASFTFAIEGLSRVASHQLVRHRLASYSQQSQRYVGMSCQSCIIPPEVAKNIDALAVFRKQAENAWNCYKELIDMGISKEDARFILPHGAETKLVMSMNARELHHFFELRLCRRAQWEIRELARQMLILVRETSPELFAVAGPSCVTEGVCAEAHSCNNPYTGVENMLSI